MTRPPQRLNRPPRISRTVLLTKCRCRSVSWPARLISPPAAKIGANIMLAKTDQALAEARIGEVQTHQTQIAALLLGLDRLAWQVATNNANVSALTSLNPTAGQQAFTAQADAAEKGIGGAMVPGTPPISSQADAAQKADGLGKQIKTLADERTQLAAKRAVVRWNR